MAVPVAVAERQDRTVSVASGTERGIDRRQVVGRSANGLAEHVDRRDLLTGTRDQPLTAPTFAGHFVGGVGKILGGVNQLGQNVGYGPHNRLLPVALEGIGDAGMQHRIIGIHDLVECLTEYLD